MRINVELRTTSDAILPWSYNGLLQGVLYSIMRRGEPQIASFLHDSGFFSDGKTYKLITFSLLRFGSFESQRDGIRVLGEAQWDVSSPVNALIEALVLGLLAEGEIRLGRSIFRIERVQVVPEPEFSERMTFATISPICASTGMRDEQGSFKKRFLSPSESDFWRVINENLKRKAALITGEEPHGDVRFDVLDEPRSKLLEINGVQVRGWMMRFETAGPVELLRAGYQAGFGERNAQGFGMVREIKKKQAKHHV